MCNTRTPVAVRRGVNHTSLVLLATALLAAAPSLCAAIDIQGVWNASLDQPRVNSVLRLTPDGPAEVAYVDIFGFEYETMNIEAFYDTGASGILLSEETANAFALARAAHNGQTVVFADVGVAGTDDFHVSQPLYFDLAPYGAERDLDNPASVSSVYTQRVDGAVRVQIGPLSGEVGGGGLGGLDVFGMPAIAGKVIVMDPAPLDAFEGPMKTYPYLPGTPFNAAKRDFDPGIPDTDWHVRMSYASFERFTTVTPEDAPPPSLRNNPFIGPNPLAALEPGAPADDTPGITVTYNGLSTTGSWLFDTGAAATIISTATAAALGVTYPDPDEPVLAGVPVDEQFQLSVGGIGGTTTKAGFFLDSLLMRTIEGDPNNDNDYAHMRYLGAPVLVLDIAVEDPVTGESMTLDGIFGMNFLVASIYVNEDPFAFGPGSVGAFEWLVFDETTGLLGLQLKNELVPVYHGPDQIVPTLFLARLPVPEPSSAALLLGGVALLCGRRRRG